MSNRDTILNMHISRINTRIDKLQQPRVTVTPIPIMLFFPTLVEDTLLLRYVIPVTGTFLGIHMSAETCGWLQLIATVFDSIGSTSTPFNLKSLNTTMSFNAPIAAGSIFELRVAKADGVSNFSVSTVFVPTLAKIVTEITDE